MEKLTSNIDDIYLDALEREATAERSAYLDDACAGNPELRRRVERLLEVQQRIGSFLESPAPEICPIVSQSITEQPGTVIGPYKLRELLGEGGMGNVFVAEQEQPIRRKVALKIIKPGMDTRQVLGRFEAERQALALMDHPNIAKVLDAGTTECGRPYFVMELVRGVPITEFCDQRRLDLRQRLELFIQVCRAIQHAHQKGIIHRDIKPSNILVTLHDTLAVPKVIDFGIAKATGQRLTEQTVYTAFNQMIGTPLYMSPEQAEMNALNVDTRSDVYSLGVLLYELLTGSTPFDGETLRQAGFDEMRRLIREVDPSRPSQRVSTLHAQAASTLSKSRGVDERHFGRVLRGDLDLIVMKALEKDRNRRYESASALADDVARYRRDEPVQACAPSTFYRFKKLARRNRIALITASLVLGALVLGTVMSTWQAVRATRAERVAETARTDEAKQRATAEANLQKAKAAVDEYFALVSESKLFDVPGLQPLRKELLEAALHFYKSSAVDRPNDPAVLADLAVTQMRVAEVNHIVDRNDDAIAGVDQALSVIDRLRREFPQAREQHRRLAGFWKGYRPLTDGTAMPKDPAAAFHSLSRLIGTWETLAREFPDEPAFRSDLGSLYHMTGELLASDSQSEGVSYFKRAQAVQELLVRDAPKNPQYRADLSETYEQLSNRLREAGRRDDAETHFREAMSLRESLVDEFPESAFYRTELYASLNQYFDTVRQRDPIEAEKQAHRANDLAESLVRDYPNVLAYRSELTNAKQLWLSARVATGKKEEITEVLRILDEWVASPPADPKERTELAKTVWLVQNVAGGLLKDESLIPKITELSRLALRLSEDLSRVFPDDPRHRIELGHSLRYLGSTTALAGNLEESRQFYERAAETFEKLATAQSGQRDGLYRELQADTLCRLGQVMIREKVDARGPAGFRASPQRSRGTGQTISRKSALSPSLR